MSTAALKCRRGSGPSVVPAIVPAVVLGVLLAGCGSAPTERSADPSAADTTAATTPETTSSGSPRASPTLPTSPAPTTPPTRRQDGRPITITGTVEEGVEAGCVVLVSARTDTSYVLLGRLVDQIEPGTGVKLRGVPLGERLATTCQQGVPLRVREILTR